MKPYLSVAEARALLALPIPESVRTKLVNKMPGPPEPIAGQTNLIDALAEQEAACPPPAPPT